MFPDLYEAMTVADFLENAHKIEIPSRWRLLNPISFCTVDMRGRPSRWEILASVYFGNVDLHFEEGERYRISDMTGDFIAGLPISAERIELGTCADPSKLTEGRYFKIGILYSPKNRLTYLETAKKFGPAQTDTEKEVLDDLVNTTA